MTFPQDEMLPDYLEITRPDDWHLHLRDHEMLARVLPYTARRSGGRDA
jgi:dihydroorotase